MMYNERRSDGKGWRKRPTTDVCRDADYHKCRFCRRKRRANCIAKEKGWKRGTEDGTHRRIERRRGPGNGC